MERLPLPQINPRQHIKPKSDHPIEHVALIGMPNAGKTALFNRLTGLRAKSSNFPGTTLEVRTGEMILEGHTLTLVDLPGLYHLGGGETEEKIAADILRGTHPSARRPDAVILVLDGTNLTRHLTLTSEVRALNLPTIVVINQMDLAQQQGIDVRHAYLSQELHAPVVLASARTGEGIDNLLHEMTRLSQWTCPINAFPDRVAKRMECVGCTGCDATDRLNWACALMRDVEVSPASPRQQKITDWTDRWVTHPVLGMVLFAAIMTGLFTTLFWLANWPMGWIDSLFEGVTQWAQARLPASLWTDLLCDGILAGVGGVVIFLPQIALLFFLLSLLEDTGYLARAAFVMDRLMQKVGLPGRAFIPMLSAHACAIPAIMSTRILSNRRDRLITIMVIPLLTCSARLPVYAMVTGLLFDGKPLIQGITTAGAYGLGVVAALVLAVLLRLTLLKGKPRELLIELPAYRRPHIRNALLSTIDRCFVFLKQAGTVILLLSIGIWAATTFPRHDEHSEIIPHMTAAQHTDWQVIQQQLKNPDLSLETRETLETQADELLKGPRMAHSVAGRVGRWVTPVFEPLGFDWRINVGVITSFAAREVMVSTMSIIAGSDDEEDTDAITAMTRPDGSPLLDTPTAMALLVFFILAMQCLPTQAVTKRETGSWKWALLQIALQSTLAWGAAFIAYRVTCWVV